MFLSRKNKKKITVLTLSFVAVILVLHANSDKIDVASLKRSINTFLKRNSLTTDGHLKSGNNTFVEKKKLLLDGHLKSGNNTFVEKKKLLLFVGIHSAPSRLDRRNAIRETWMTECRRTLNVVCRFFTDGQDPKGQRLKKNIIIALENETTVYDDISVMYDIPGGINFAIKYLWMLQWASEQYDFQYFLRLDDDYFICFHKLVLELGSRPKEKFHWGWLHCSLKAATWLDEGFYLASKDMVESFLIRKDTLMCHVWESQAIGYWIKNISNITTFADNKRLLHIQTGFNSEKEIADKTEICHSLIGIHQSYAEKMRAFWRIYKQEKKNVAYYVPPISYNCENPLAMNYMVFKNSNLWFSEPKLCKDKPTWDRDGEYEGRQGQR